MKFWFSVLFSHRPPCSRPVATLQYTGLLSTESQVSDGPRKLPQIVAVVVKTECVVSLHLGQNHHLQTRKLHGPHEFPGLPPAWHARSANTDFNNCLQTYFPLYSSVSTPSKSGGTSLFSHVILKTASSLRKQVSSSTA